MDGEIEPRPNTSQPRWTSRRLGNLMLRESNGTLGTTYRRITSTDEPFDWAQDVPSLNPDYDEFTPLSADSN